MLKIQQSLRGAYSASVDENKKGVTIYDDTSWVRYWLAPNLKDLMFQLEGEQEQVLLDDVIKNVHFDSPTPNTVTVTLELQEDQCESELSSTIMMRNYGSGT